MVSPGSAGPGEGPLEQGGGTGCCAHRLSGQVPGSTIHLLTTLVGR